MTLRSWVPEGDGWTEENVTRWLDLEERRVNLEEQQFQEYLQRAERQGEREENFTDKKLEIELQKVTNRSREIALRERAAE